MCPYVPKSPNVCKSPSVPITPHPHNVPKCPHIVPTFPLPQMSRFPVSPNPHIPMMSPCVPTDPYSYDLPEDISSGLGSSFASILELAGAHTEKGELGDTVVIPR